MNIHNFSAVAVIFAFVAISSVSIWNMSAYGNESSPNVVIILADDLGYGDLSCYGARVHQTPHIDSLSEQGLRFTQGFATSSTCTPSRFGLMTGLYPCRQKGVHILPGDAPLIINPKSMTLPRLFQKAGYATCAVGKWHLGMGDGNVDWNKKITPGLNELGFDHSFVMAATNDRTPTVFIEDGQVVNLTPNDPLEVNYRKNFEGEPEYKTNPELVTKQKSMYGHDGSVHNGVGRIGFQKGGKSARWNDETMAETFRAQTDSFIRKAVKDQKPFFVYYALHQPHVPRMPGAAFAGKSPLGLRGDVILEADWQVGELVKLLQELKVSENTMIVFTSDNGPVLNDGYAEQAVEKNTQTGHTPSGILRGGKYSDYSGGTQIPFIVYWPTKVKPGVSDALVCQVDFIASFAQMLNVSMPELANMDSQNIFDALIGKTDSGRTSVLLNSRTVRTARWSLTPSAGKNQNRCELYDMVTDKAQKFNVAKEHPKIVERLKEQYEQIINRNFK